MVRKESRKSQSGSKKRKLTKKDLEGRQNKTKARKLQCKVCGKYFRDLAEINSHYSHVGHKRQKKPPKKFKFPEEFSERDIELAKAIITMFKNPTAIRQAIREARARQRRFELDEYYR